MYRTHGLASGLMHKRPMKNGSIQILDHESTREHSSSFSDSNPKKTILMAKRIYLGMMSILDSKTVYAILRRMRERKLAAGWKGMKAVLPSRTH